MGGSWPRAAPPAGRRQREAPGRRRRGSPRLPRTAHLSPGVSRGGGRVGFCPRVCVPTGVKAGVGLGPRAPAVGGSPPALYPAGPGRAAGGGGPRQRRLSTPPTPLHPPPRCGPPGAAPSVPSSAGGCPAPSPASPSRRRANKEPRRRAGYWDLSRRRAQACQVVFGCRCSGSLARLEDVWSVGTDQY